MMMRVHTFGLFGSRVAWSYYNWIYSIHVGRCILAALIPSIVCRWPEQIAAKALEGGRLSRGCARRNEAAFARSSL